MTREDRLIYIKQMETAKSSTASFDQDTFGMLLRQEKLEKLDNPKEDADKVKALQMRDAVKAGIETMKRNTGKDPSDEEKKKIMMGVIADRSYISQWFTDPQVPTSSLTKEERKKAYKNVSGTEIPIDSYDRIISELTSAGNESITDGDILSKFNELKSKK